MLLPIVVPIVVVVDGRMIFVVAIGSTVPAAKIVFMFIQISEKKKTYLSNDLIGKFKIYLLILTFGNVKLTAIYWIFIFGGSNNKNQCDCQSTCNEKSSDKAIIHPHHEGKYDAEDRCLKKRTIMH